MTGLAHLGVHSEKAAGPNGRLIFLTGDDRDRLNRFVIESNQGHFRQLYEWGEVMAHDGTRVVRLGVERDGRLCASLALYVRRIPRTPWTVLTSPRGPVVDLEDEDAFATLIRGVRSLASPLRAVFFRLDPDHPHETPGLRPLLERNRFRHLPKDWSWLGEPRIVMRANLALPEAELLARMRTTHRQLIRAADKRRLAVRPARDESELERFTDILDRQCRAKGLPMHSRDYFRALWRHIVRSGFGELFLIEHDGEICAGGLAVVCGRKSWVLYTAMEPHARRLATGEPTYWQIMRWGKERGAEMCDFGGSGTGWPPSQDSPGYSLYLFKSGFRAEAVYLAGYFDLVFRPALYRLGRLAEDRVLEGRPALLNLLRPRSR